MSLAWTAASARARLLSRRRLGPAASRSLAGQADLGAARRLLVDSPYGREVGRETTIDQLQRALQASVLWHLRILAGWAPPSGGPLLRTLAARFEIANVEDRLSYLGGAPLHQPYELGRLATAWDRLRHAGSAGEMRAKLARSRWGDPGSEDLVGIRWAMLLRWAGWLRGGPRPMRPWVEGAVALLTARLIVAGADAVPEPVRLRWELLVPGAGRALSLEDVAALVPDGAWALQLVTSPQDLWWAESQWWERMERDAQRVLKGNPRNPDAAVGLAGLLVADARRVGATLEAVGRGPAARSLYDAIG